MMFVHGWSDKVVGPGRGVKAGTCAGTRRLSYPAASRWTHQAARPPRDARGEPLPSLLATAGLIAAPAASFETFVKGFQSPNLVTERLWSARRAIFHDLVGLWATTAGRGVVVDWWLLISDHLVFYWFASRVCFTLSENRPPPLFNIWESKIILNKLNNINRCQLVLEAWPRKIITSTNNNLSCL